jgi:hypothetical protein
MTLRFVIFVGEKMVSLLPDLARLCTTVFREWLYLYEAMAAMTLTIWELLRGVRGRP